MCWDVKGHSTQCNFFPWTGKNRKHVLGCQIDDQGLFSDFIELFVALAIVKCEDQFSGRVQPHG